MKISREHYCLLIMAGLTEIGMFSSEMEAEFLTCEAEFSTTTAPGEEMSQDAGTSEHELSLVPRPFCTSACAHPHNRMRVRKRRVWGNGWPSHGQKLECENGARMQLVRIMSVH